MRFQSSSFDIVLVAATAACATAGATYQSGVAPKTFDTLRSTPGTRLLPRVAGRTPRPSAISAGASRRAVRAEGRRGSAAAALVAEMNAFLDSLAVSKRVTTSATEAGTPPNVRFGCPSMRRAIARRRARFRGGSNRRLELSVGRPSQEWITWLGGALDASTDHALLITLELGQYWPARKA
jgi:hypothetical protein